MKALKVFQQSTAFKKVTFFWVISLVLLWVGFNFYNDHDKEQIIFVGDSFIGNYRMEEGNRLQDHLNNFQKEKIAANFAEPGAKTFDFYMQYFKADLVAPEADWVIIGLNPTKMFPEKKYHRMDSQGDNLKWLPFSQVPEMWPLLDEEHQSKFLYHKAGLLFGVADALRYAWIVNLLWPFERKIMRKANSKRFEKIKQYAKAQGHLWETYKAYSYQEFSTTQSAQDLSLFLQYLQKAKKKVIVLITPVAHPDLVETYFSQTAKDRFSLSHQHTIEWCKRRNLNYVDFNTPHYKNIFSSAEHWDDFYHTKSGHSNYIIAQVISETISTLEKTP